MSRPIGRRFLNGSEIMFRPRPSVQKWLQAAGQAQDIAPPRRLGIADRPAPRADKNSQLAHEQLVEKAKQGGIDIYFVGDSITRRWGTSDPAYKAMLANWKQNFFGWNAADFGWGADRIQNILVAAGERRTGWRESKDHCRCWPAPTTSAHSRGDDEKVADITSGIKAVVDVCRSKGSECDDHLDWHFPAQRQHGRHADDQSRSTRISRNLPTGKTFAT